MTNNIGKDFIHYKVIDFSDDPINPKSGTLRYETSVIQGKVWITLQRNMHIKFERPLLISSFTTVDGHQCNHPWHSGSLSQTTNPWDCNLPEGKIWIDHNTLYDCQDGLFDVTRDSIYVTISKNWFINQDKVMFLGHGDGCVRDYNMKVIITYNHFEPNSNQRIRRTRYEYVHVANNLYLEWV
ncbi:hypothetical protein CR513_25808, partial [Mucuna pruriens]